jgi:hypothetical protein
MNSHNTKAAFSFHKTPATSEADGDEAKVVSATLESDASLSIADDPDLGCDPYNSTGHHVIIDAKLVSDKD